MTEMEFISSMKVATCTIALRCYDRLDKLFLKKKLLILIMLEAILCHGDLSLERPTLDSKNRPILAGWGSVHMCRDEQALLDSLWEKSIRWDGEKWVRRSKPRLL